MVKLNLQLYQAPRTVDIRHRDAIALGQQALAHRHAQAARSARYQCNIVMC